VVLGGEYGDYSRAKARSAGKDRSVDKWEYSVQTEEGYVISARVMGLL